MLRTESTLVAVSVVIATFNSAKYIRETLESVLAETYPPPEIIVVDDGSTDETAAIVRSYAGRVRLLQQEHRSQPEARNLGIRKAQGNFIAVVDSDDLWLPEKLERQVSCLLEKKVEWVSCGVDFFNNSTGETLPRYRKKLYEGDVLEQLLMDCFVLSPTPVVKKTVFEEVGYFNDTWEVYTGEDWDMWLRIAACYPLGMVHEMLALKREHPASLLTITSVEEKLRFQVLTIEWAIARQPERLSPLKNRALAKLYLHHGATLLKQGQYEQARELIAHAWQLNPFNLSTGAYWLILHSGEPGRTGYRIFRKAKNLRG